MEAHPRTAFSERGLTLLGGEAGPRTLDFITAEMHYWRVPPPSWGACLAAVRRLGFEIVSTYVPWDVHETGPGRFDWSGPRDLAGFLAEVERAGMVAVLKPGPHINAELTHFGYPRRVLADPAVQALSARGTPVWLPAPPHMFPVPSYASAAFRAAAGEWLRAFARVAQPLSHPDGPVVAFQVDNEAQMFFRVGAFDQDYHPDALVWWREHAAAAGVGEEPPRQWDPADMARCVEWVRFKEEYVERSLRWVRDELDGAGLSGLARTHNAPPSHPHLVHLPRAARAVGGPAGLDFYHRARDYDQVRRRALYLGGSAEPLPIAAEIGVGGPPWLPPMTAGDQEEVTRGILAGGARGLSFFMVVDRDRWYGAPISVDGEARPPAEWLGSTLAGLRSIGWSGLSRRARVGVVVSRAEARVAIASSLVDPLSPVVAEILAHHLGPGGAAELSLDRDAARHRRWCEGVITALDRARVSFALLDEEAPADRFARFPVLVAPTLARVDRALWRRLRAAAEGDQVVVIGPERPSRDERGESLPAAEAALPRRIGLMRPGSLDDLDGLAQDLAAAAGSPDGDGFHLSPESDQVHLSIFEDTDGAVRVIAVGNPSASTSWAQLTVPAGATLACPFTGDRPRSREHVAEIELAPHQVRLFRADR